MVAGIDHTYVVALGSNMRAPGVGGPRQVLKAALASMEAHCIELNARSKIIASRPVGPSQRLYANAAALVSAKLDPPAMLATLQRIEADFGRTRRGARWRSRPLDLDIVLWSGGAWLSPDLAIPHPQFRTRSFVVGPAAEVAPDWRDPSSGLTLRQLKRRLASRQ